MVIVVILPECFNLGQKCLEHMLSAIFCFSDFVNSYNFCPEHLLVCSSESMWNSSFSMMSKSSSNVFSTES